MRFEVIRNITKKECPWLDKYIQKGTIVFSYSGCTYGCCSNEGTAVTLIENKTPFFEIPQNAIVEI